MPASRVAPIYFLHVVLLVHDAVVVARLAADVLAGRTFLFVVAFVVVLVSMVALHASVLMAAFLPQAVVVACARKGMEEPQRRHRDDDAWMIADVVVVVAAETSEESWLCSRWQ